jgi:hypothetical protein
LAEFIDVPIETDPQDVIEDSFTFMRAAYPGWEPGIGNLDVWIMQSFGASSAETRDVASRVPRSIFRYFGATLAGVPPLDATTATCFSTWTMLDNAGYTVRAGTQVGIARTGDEVYAFETVADFTVSPGSTVANNVQLVAVDAGADSSGLGGAGTVISLLDPLSFVSTITQVATTTGGSDAESDDAYLDRLASELQLLAPRPILAADFATFAREIPGVYRATVNDGYNPFHNLLTANEASAETDASGWVSGGNATISSTTAQAADGIRSVGVTAVAAADMSATLSNSKTVTPGDTITALASARSAVTARSTKVGIQWRDASDAVLSTVYGVAANDATAAWTAYSVTAIAPVGAVKARLLVTFTAPAAAEVHYIDKMSLRRGAGTDWVAGGTSEVGNPRTITVAGVDSAGNPLDSAHKASVQADLQSRREVNFIVNMADPTVNLIDVTYNVKALVGYDLPTLITSINAALAAYLSKATWGTAGGDANSWTNAPTIRYLEVAQVINGVTGVDYITTTAGNYDLTIGIHGGALARLDVNMGGFAPLPSLSTVTGTAS